MYLTERHAAFNIAPGRHLLCNAITGELGTIGDRGMQLLETLRRGATVDSPAMQDELAAKRFLFVDQADEERAFRDTCATGWQGFQASVPRHYTFILNTHCNFNCPYCFEHESLRSRAATLSREQIDAALLLVDAEATGEDVPPEFEVFGGETLLPPSLPILEYLLAALAGRGYTTSLQTNGYYLEDSLPLLTKYQKELRQLQIALDGPRAVHDRRRIPRSGQPTFDRIVAGIDALRARELPIGLALRMNVDRENVGALGDMAQVYQERGWTDDRSIGFTAAPVDNRSGTLQNEGALLTWLELLREVYPLSLDTGGGPFDLAVFKALGFMRASFSSLRQQPPAKADFLPRVVYCEAAALKLSAFHPDGRIYACPETVGQEHMAIGRYYPECFLDEERAGLWREQTILKREECRTCAISTLCGGGCLLNALVHHGSATRPVCEDAPEIVRFYVEQMAAATG